MTRTVLVDLTMPISPAMHAGPDHRLPTFDRYSDLAEAGWEATMIGLSSHLGTHLDAPSHFVAGAATVESIPLSVLTGPAQVIHLAGLRPHEQIGPDQLGAITAERVLLDTGWTEHLADAHRYFEEHPYLTDEVGDYLVSHGVRLLGIDTPSVDLHPPSAVHLALLGAGAVIVENLIGLDRLGSTSDFTVLPLPLVGLDGSPARAIGTAERPV